MKLRLLSWNVRGANDSSKRKVIKAMIRSQRVDLFCIQETKIQAMTEGLVRSLGSGRFLNWGTLDAHGFAGGLLICWDKRTLEVLEIEAFLYRGKGVYVEEIGAIRGIWDDPWCLGGDFNVILSQRERSNQGRLTSAMRRFAQIVDELKLIDLPLQGGCPDLPQIIFLSVMGGRLRRGPSLFRFENMWLKADGFTDLLRGGEGGIVNAFQYLLSEEPGWRADIESCTLIASIPVKLKSWSCLLLKRKFTLPLMEMNGDKALGLDGFTVAFWQSSWEFVKEEIVDLFKEFYDQRSFAKSLNTTFLVEEGVRQGVSGDQNAFVRGKQILDVSLIANEWIWWCISTAKFSVVINGVLAGFFSNSKGLRQGDPLSPINLDKSVLIPVGEMEEIEEMAVELGCKVGFLPTVYLGLPLEPITKLFLYGMGGRENEEKISPVEKTIYIEGFAFENDNLWKMVIGVKYGQEDFGWRTKEARGTYGVGVWKEIMKEAKWCWDSIKFKDFRISLEEDSVLWKGGGHGKFGVKDAYNVLVVPNACAFSTKCTWVDKVPTKAAFLLGKPRGGRFSP
ncbi:hypothetical protein CK203_014505 [Vitis vinifera]|uniref:Endonuclease/exonuclease/phosphatase domain-containing protein n=1 Tax=Vitis vinifera TaxID=29760 RepID=A0A438K4U6_VITVI|nr:hypothetical protein CK203_014505 [Vitis vinifera]